jgi:hypothetical protein
MMLLCEQGVERLSATALRLMTRLSVRGAIIKVDKGLPDMKKPVRQELRSC